MTQFSSNSLFSPKTLISGFWDLRRPRTRASGSTESVHTHLHPSSMSMIVRLWIGTLSHLASRMPLSKPKRTPSLKLARFWLTKVSPQRNSFPSSLSYSQPKNSAMPLANAKSCKRSPPVRGLWMAWNEDQWPQSLKTDPLWGNFDITFVFDTIN